MQVSDLLNLTEGGASSPGADRRAVEITVNSRRIARGEITVLENDVHGSGVKLIEVLVQLTVRDGDHDGL